MIYFNILDRPCYKHGQCQNNWPIRWRKVLWTLFSFWTYWTVLNILKCWLLQQRWKSISIWRLFWKDGFWVLSSCKWHASFYSEVALVIRIKTSSSNIYWGYCQVKYEIEKQIPKIAVRHYHQHLVQFNIIIINWILSFYSEVALVSRIKTEYFLLINLLGFTIKMNTLH